VVLATLADCPSRGVHDGYLWPARFPVRQVFRAAHGASDCHNISFCVLHVKLGLHQEIADWPAKVDRAIKDAKEVASTAENGEKALNTGIASGGGAAKGTDRKLPTTSPRAR
jgi:hypothetical protein